MFKSVGDFPVLLFLSTPYVTLFSGTGKNPSDDCLAGLHETLQKYPWPTHGACSQVHPLQLDERIQAMGSLTACSVSDWRQRSEGKLGQNMVAEKTNMNLVIFNFIPKPFTLLA